MPLLRLVRLPGIFTAFADILAGYLIVRFAGSGAGEIRSLGFLLGASACIYMAGMVWNDVFDYEEDRVSRPERPLPSGLVSLTGAFMIGVILSVAGLMRGLMPEAEGIEASPVSASRMIGVAKPHSPALAWSSAGGAETSMS